MTASPHGQWRLWLRRLGFLGAPAGLAVAYFLQGAGQDAPSAVTWATIIAGTAITFAAGVAADVYGGRQARTASDAVDVARSARVEATLPIKAIIAPALQALQEIIDAVDDADRKVKKDRLKQLIVILMMELGDDTEHNRACYFEHLVENTSTGPVRVLRCDGPLGLWRGKLDRHTPPRKEFRDKDRDPAGADRFAMLDRRETIVVTDVEKTEPPGWPGDRDYRSFIAASVATATDVFGFLGVDSPAPGNFNDSDVEVSRQLASILAVGLSID